jgi:dephospho-CoA kinase
LRGASEVKIIGLAGGSGSGKGTVSFFLADYGILPIDTDKIYHELISGDSECTRELSVTFGDSIISVDGSVDRRKLSGIVFSDKSKLEMLNKITHFHVLNEVRARITKAKEQGYAAVIVDAPLLFESGFYKECDFMISVIADTETRIKRICSRDAIDTEQAKIRIIAQLSDTYLIENSDYVITNNGDLDDLKCAAEKIIKKIILQ